MASTSPTPAAENEMVNIPVGVLHDVSPLLRVYKDGRVERLVEQPPPIPPSLDPHTGVESKDIFNIFPDRQVSLRLFKPPHLVKDKLPLLVYFHGGGFCIESTFSPLYHPYLNSLSSHARVLIASVEYRLAPEHPLPAAYHDCWDALDWLLSHSLTPTASSAPASTREPWIADHADFSRVFLAGDSAGGNITHHMALRVGTQGLAGGSVRRITGGIILFHPFFWSKHRIGDEAAKLKRQQNSEIADQLWTAICPTSRSGLDDPWVNPAQDPSLSRLGCDRVLIFVAEEDFLRDRGVHYKELLEKSGWQGKVELVESPGEDHVFHLFYPTSPNAVHLMNKVADFLNPPLPPAAAHSSNLL